MDQGTKRGRGRPPKAAAERKRNNVTIRLRDATKASLEAAAVEHQRSLSEEIEHRLERSFTAEDALGGPQLADVVETVAKVMKFAGEIAAVYAQRPPDTWMEDPYCFSQAAGAAARTLESLRPPGPIVEPKIAPAYIAKLEARANETDPESFASKTGLALADALIHADQMGARLADVWQMSIQAAQHREASKPKRASGRVSRKEPKK